jgi:excisionase family DNA binding protein
MPTHRQPPGGYLTSGQAGAILAVSAKTVNRYAREGKLPYSRTLGGHRRYNEAEIRALLDQHTVRAGEGLP